MDSLRTKLIKPESTLIEKTALELAAAFYEVGRSQGLKSRYKNPKDYARQHVKEFIPKAVSILMDILANDKTPQVQRDAILDAFLERANDKDLSNSGIPVFENPLASTFIPDTQDNRKPIVVNSSKNKGRIEDLPLENMLAQSSIPTTKGN